jgi:hypothetical protein
MGPLSFILRCRPLAGFWDKSLNADCYSLDLFIRLGLASTGKNSLSIKLSKNCSLTLILRHSIWNGHQRNVRNIARSRDLETPYATTYPIIPDWHFQHRLPVSD